MIEAVLVVLTKARHGREAGFNDWYETHYLPAVMRRPGVKPGALLVFRAYGQMIPSIPVHRFVALYRRHSQSARHAETGRSAAAHVQDSYDAPETTLSPGGGKAKVCPLGGHSRLDSSKRRSVTNEKTVLVTGATRGMARGFASLGYRL